MPKYIKPLIAVVVVAGRLALLTACGATAPGDPSKVRSIVATSEPLDVTEGHDTSKTDEATGIREEDLRGAMKVVEAVLRQGGSLHLGAFFSRGFHGAALLKT